MLPILSCISTCVFVVTSVMHCNAAQMRDTTFGKVTIGVDECNAVAALQVRSRANVSVTSLVGLFSPNAVA